MQAKIFLVVVQLCFALQGSSLEVTSSTECHPRPNEQKTHYIIGYGSLINAESKNRTYPETGINIPVRVAGFERSWTARGYSNTSLSTTYLGVQKDRNSYLNGVIFTVPNAVALEKYDARERYYCRVNVPLRDITIVRGKISDNGTFPREEDLLNSEFWIYETMPNLSEYPNEKYPIVQSYVDIFLGGCVQMELKYGLSNYSDECVSKTVGWDYPWVNDRLHPRRPFAYQTYAGLIDKLLDRNIKGYHENTYVEKIHIGRSTNSGSLLDRLGIKVMLGYVVLVVSWSYV